LWKQSTSNRDRRGVEYRKGDDWSERVACEVGRLVGVPTAEVELAVYGDMVGVVSRRFLRQDAVETLVHGNELLSAVTTVGDHPRDRTGYTLDAVRRSLEGAGPPCTTPDIGGAGNWFAGYLLLDALIGNTDRHQENWGVIRTDAESTLAPSFDHASCLGFLLSDDERIERLNTNDENRGAARFAERAQSKFEERLPTRLAAIAYLRGSSDQAGQFWVSAIANMPPTLRLVLPRVPPDRMSVPARSFADAVYRLNLEWLSQHLRTMRP
jgi:hypothetical protein